MCPAESRCFQPSEPVYGFSISSQSASLCCESIAAAMAPTTVQVNEPRTDRRFQDDGNSSIDSAIEDILPPNIPNTIITNAPEERFRLGYWSVIALVVNRTIGFNS